MMETVLLLLLALGGALRLVAEGGVPGDGTLDLTRVRR
jgi:hypothetical protein